MPNPDRQPCNAPPARRLRTALALAALLSLCAWQLQGCDGCSPKRLRRFGLSCGRASECEGGLCFQGYCTKPCTTKADCGGGICVANVCLGADGDFDGDGLSNNTEDSLLLDPAKADTDGDGVPDGVEVGDIANPADQNGDGIIDARQSDVADADGDCMVDAVDNDPADGTGANLPPVAELCANGVCAGNLANVEVVCVPTSLADAPVVLGCKGCICQADTNAVPEYEANESLCDGLDNDCDGATDEALSWLGAGVGASCSAAAGICAAPGPGGIVAVGEVECAANGEVVCSTGAGGSQSLALPERCNGADDDCDGVADNGFTLDGAPLGSSCAGCGDTVPTCSDGTPAAPAVVRCSTAGDSAVCSSVPFAPGFEVVSSGAPPPRAGAALAFSAKWQRVLAYGGMAPTAHGVVDQSGMWSLATDESPAPWQLLADQPPGPRADAALIWDEIGERVLLIGGSSSAGLPTAVWAWSINGGWTQVSDAATALADQVPALPATGGLGATDALVLDDPGGRRVVVFVAKQPLPIQAQLGGPAPPKWLTVKTAPPGGSGGIPNLTGRIRCAMRTASSGAVAFVLATATPSSPQAHLYRLEVAAGLARAAPLAGGLSPAPAEGAQCFVDASGNLHIIEVDGAAPNFTTRHRLGVLSGAAATAGSVTWSEAALPAAVDASFARLGALMQPEGDDVIVAGGIALFAETTLTTHRSGLVDAQRWPLGAAGMTRLDRPGPGGRIGHAAAVINEVGFCVAGGLRIELPDANTTTPRIVADRTVWCIDPATDLWQLRLKAGPLFAFGVDAVDATTNSWLLAGGLALQEGTAVIDIAAMWENGLGFDETTQPSNLPTLSGAIHRVDVAAGTSKIEPTIAPALAAAAFALDETRNRLLVFGGFTALGASEALASLDLTTATWQDLGGPAASGKSLFPRYGAIMVYMPALDVLAVTGGVLRTVVPTGADPYSMQGPNDPAVIDDCVGNAEEVVWLTRPEPSPIWQATAVPTFADLNAKPPVLPLLRPFFGGPSFLPVVFDPIGGSAVLAVQERPRLKVKDSAGQACPGDFVPKWTETPVHMSLRLGLCPGGPQVFVDHSAITPMPDAMMLSRAAYGPAGRETFVFGGLHTDGRVSGRLWRLSQVCVGGAP